MLIVVKLSYFKVREKYAFGSPIGHPHHWNRGSQGPTSHQTPITLESRVPKPTKIPEKYESWNYRIPKYGRNTEEIRVVKLSYSKIREKYGRNTSRKIVVFQNTREIREKYESYNYRIPKYERNTSRKMVVFQNTGEIWVVKLSYSKIREKYGRNTSRKIVVFQNTRKIREKYES